MNLNELLTALQDYPGHNYETVAEVFKDRPRRTTFFGMFNVLSAGRRLAHHEQRIKYRDFIVDFTRDSNDEIRSFQAESYIQMPNPEFFTFVDSKDTCLVEGVVPKPSGYKIMERIGEDIAKSEGISFKTLDAADRFKLGQHFGRRASHLFYALDFALKDTQTLKGNVDKVVGCKNKFEDLINQEMRNKRKEEEALVERLRDYRKSLTYY